MLINTSQSLRRHLKKVSKDNLNNCKKILKVYNEKQTNLQDCLNGIDFELSLPGKSWVDIQIGEDENTVKILNKLIDEEMSIR